MLRADVLDVINSGQAWCFVGAGVSADAGLPSWGQLLHRVREAVDGLTPTVPVDSEILEQAVATGNLPLAFQILEESFGRSTLTGAVQASIESRLPGPLGEMVIDLPFAGYITSNYDRLLETGLANRPGWVSVGNSGSEVRKVSGDVQNLVWHLHGDETMTEDRSHLVITRSDYDSLYLDEAPAMKQLQGLLSHRRIVFLGFSFVDDDLVALLKRVGRL